MLRSIAIDGPAASGKTVVGRRLAESLGYWFLDTGIMYRAVTWLAMERQVSPEDADALERLAVDVQVRPISRTGDSVEVAGRGVGSELREPRVDANVSEVSRHPSVRRAMVEQQRAYADAVLRGNGTSSGCQAPCREGIVMIGRDIGTIVLPAADLKVYLTASARERARRRCLEMLERGQTADLDSVHREIEARDAIDSSRADSPLRPADDAWQLDGTCLGVEDVVGLILGRVQGG